MDLSENTDKKVNLYKRKRNRDGTVTITIDRHPENKKTVIAKGKGKKTVGAVIASQLQPFCKSMKKGLQMRGYSVNNVPLKEIIPLYYNEFVSNKDNNKSPFVPVNSFEFRNNPVWKINLSDNLNGSFSDYKNTHYVNEVNQVIDNIISVFRDAKIKKDTIKKQGANPNELLTDEELIQANAAEKVENELTNKLYNSEPVTWSEVKDILKIVFFFWIAFVCISEL